MTDFVNLFHNYYFQIISLFIELDKRYLVPPHRVIKGIVSRDWGELQMIPVDSLEVFSIAGSYFYFF